MRSLALLWIAGLAAVACLTTSCRTIEGRYLDDEMKHGECVDGVPISVQKARFLAITYKTVIYGQRAGARTEMVDDQAYVVSGGYVITSTQEEVETEVVTAAEVFAVDTKRPASGNITYAYEFDAGSSYPKKLTTKVEDSTVEELVALAKAIKGEVTADSISEANERRNAEEERRRALRGAGALVKLTEAVDRIEYYDLWKTDQTGFPKFAFLVEMTDADRSSLAGEAE